MKDLRELAISMGYAVLMMVNGRFPFIPGFPFSAAEHEKRLVGIRATCLPAYGRQAIGRFVAIHPRWPAPDRQPLAKLPSPQIHSLKIGNNG